MYLKLHYEKCEKKNLKKKERKYASTLDLLLHIILNSNSEL